MYSIAVLPRDLKLVLGGSGHLYILNIFYLSSCSILTNFYWTIVHQFKLLPVLFSGGLTLEFAFLKDVDVGVTAYCLPEDKTIGEFGCCAVTTGGPGWGGGVPPEQLLVPLPHFGLLRIRFQNIT